MHNYAWLSFCPLVNWWNLIGLGSVLSLYSCVHFDVHSSVGAFQETCIHLCFVANFRFLGWAAKGRSEVKHWNFEPVKASCLRLYPLPSPQLLPQLVQLTPSEFMVASWFLTWGLFTWGEGTHATSIVSKFIEDLNAWGSVWKITPFMAMVSV